MRIARCLCVCWQHVTYRSGRKVRKTTSTVARVDKQDVLARTSAQWHNDSVDVPVGLVASSTTRSQRNIDIKYTLAVSISYCQYSSVYLSVCLSVYSSSLLSLLGRVALVKGVAG